LDRLLSMQAFVATVERGSLAAAGRALELTAPMIGKHVDSLERRLGVRLLTRTTRRQKLTDAGREFFEHCKQVLRAIDDAERGARSRQAAPSGTLRVCAPVTFGSLRLAPVIAEFLMQNPRIDVELDLREAPVDLVEEGFDAAIRIGRLADSSLIGRSLEPYRMMICAAPAYLAEHGTPRTPEDLAALDCLNFSHWDKRGGWALGRRGALAKLPAARLRSNHGQALRQAALHGAGLIMQPAILLAEDVRAGRLVEVLARHLRPARAVSLVYLRDHQAPPRLTRFIDLVVKRLGASSRR
jgi:DNA-binding transcriptional LysR family regulator